MKSLRYFLLGSFVGLLLAGGALLRGSSPAEVMCAALLILLVFSVLLFGFLTTAEWPDYSEEYFNLYDLHRVVLGSSGAAALTACVVAAVSKLTLLFSMGMFTAVGISLGTFTVYVGVCLLCLQLVRGNQ